MKFVCDQCKTKYSIADDRVRGKVLKIRCKQCNHVVTVREETATRTTGPNASIPAPSKALEQALDQSFSGGQDFEGSERTQISSGVDIDALIAASGKPAAAARAPARTDGDWFVSFDGLQEGPITLVKLIARVRAETGREAHAWREGFEGWLPVAKVPEIAAALRPKDPTPVPPPRPRTNTPRPPVPAAALRSPTPAAVAQAARRDPTGRPAVPMRPSATPAPAAAMAKSSSRPGVDQPTLLERPAPQIPMSPMSGGGRSAPATALAAAAAVPHRVPTIDTTPAPLPAPPVVEPTPAPILAPPVAAASLPVPLSVGAHGPSAAPAPITMQAPAPAAVPELLISEPSMVAALPSGFPIGANGHSSAPAPVVIITGPARASSPALKFALLGGGAVIVALLGTVGYLLYGHRPVVVAALPPAPIVEKGIPVDDQPATAIDPQPNVVAPHPPVAPIPGKVDPAAKLPSVKKPTGPKTPTKNLSGNQAALEKLYGDSEKAPAHDLPSVPRPEAKQAQVSETQLADVVRKNKQSLTICYERVLKRDNQLRNARIDVDVKVGISGSVTKVAMPDSYAGTEIATCLSQAIKRWHFPSLDSEYGTSFPLLLQAQ